MSIVNKFKRLILCLVVFIFVSYLILSIGTSNSLLYNNKEIQKFIFLNSLTFNDKCNKSYEGKISPQLGSINQTQIYNKYYPNILNGGIVSGDNCNSTTNIAIIVTYRDREDHLNKFLNNLYPLLIKQGNNYQIFIVEQISNQTFNRGKLINVGFIESLKYNNFECFIFHDVDLIPEDDRIPYICNDDNPVHISVGVNTMKYKLMYPDLFGGITALTKDQFEEINGFSNDFWGWGGEDDDAAMRLFDLGYNISRPSIKIARYKMLQHEKHKNNPVNICRYKLLLRTNHTEIDGYNSCLYKVLENKTFQLYTRIYVDLLEDISRKLLIRAYPDVKDCPDSEGDRKKYIKKFLFRKHGKKTTEITLNWKRLRSPPEYFNQ